MTVIAGIAQGGLVYMGGDSQATASWSATTRIDRKVWVDGEWVFGYSGGPRVAQLLRWDFDRPTLKDEQPIEAYLATDFTKAYRTVLREGGALKTENGIDEADDKTRLMLGHAGRLFVIHSDFQVAETTDGYAAIGSGDDLALGALYATRRQRDPRRRIRIALEAAAKFNIGCGPPFTVADIGGDGE